MWPWGRTSQPILRKIHSPLGILSFRVCLQFSSVAQSYLTLWDPMDCSTSGLTVHYQLPELLQTHVHRVSDAIQPSHPLSSLSRSCLQSFPASGSFPVSQFFASGSQSIGSSASASILPVKIQDWFHLRLPVWSPCSPRDSQESSPTLQLKNILSSALSFLIVPHSHPYMTTGKTIALTRQTFVGKVMSLLFNMLSRLVIAFLPRSKHLFISWLQSPSPGIFGAPQNKVLSLFPHLFAMKWWDQMPWF